MRNVHNEINNRFSITNERVEKIDLSVELVRKTV